MVEFNASQTDAPQLNTAQTPQAGVVQSFKGVEDFSKILDNITESVNKSKSDSVLNGFFNQQMNMVDAVAQGRLSSEQAQMGMRINLINAVNSYQSLRDDLVAINKDVLGQGGMGGIVLDGTREEEKRRALEDTLIREGYVPPNATPEVMDAAIYNYNISQEANRRYDEDMKLLNMESAQVGLAQSILNYNQDVKTETSLRWLKDTTPSNLNRIDVKVQELSSDPNMTEAEKEVELSRLWQDIQLEVSSKTADLSSTQSEAILTALEQRVALGNRILKGELSDEEMARAIDRSDAEVVALAYGNPKIARYYGIMKHMPVNFRLPAEGEVRDALAEFLLTGVNGMESQNPNPTAPAPANNPFRERGSVEGKALDSYLKTVSELYYDDSTREEAAAHLQSILSGVTSYSSLIEQDPLKAEALINWMATDSFLEMLQGGNVDVDMNNLRQILQTHYADEVFSMVQRTFKENSIIDYNAAMETGPLQGDPYNHSVQETPVPQAVGYFWSKGGGIQFTAIDPENALAVGMAKRMNKSMSPVINNTIKAFAHLGGNNDYQQVFEALAPGIMDQRFTTDVGDNPNLSDFSQENSSFSIEDTSKENVSGYIRSKAEQLGIDPDIALRVAASEGLNADPSEGWQSSFMRNGKREESFGPYQLFMGGGLGNEFQRITGNSPRDPSTWQQQVDFALQHASKNGWGSWYGARNTGIGDWDGIPRRTD